MVTTKDDNNSFAIDQTKNLVFADLYNAGKRITGTSKLCKNNEFYAVVHKRNPTENLDETQIQKYQLIKDNNNDNKCGFNVKFLELSGTIFKDGGVNSEGIAIIETDDNQQIGFLIVNDLFCKPKPNSNIYFIDIKCNKSSIIYTLNDDGLAELNDICEYKDKSFNKDGYIILPQALMLNTMNENNNKPNWEPFEKWVVSNDGDASLLFINRQNLLQVVTDNDDKKKNHDDNKNDIVIENIAVYLCDNHKSVESIFNKYTKK